MNLIKKQKVFVVDALTIILGCFIASLGVNLFLVHAKLLSGGATGIGLIFEYKFGINSGIIVLLINLPLFILSYLKLNKKFTIYSIIGSLSLSLFLVVTAKFKHLISLNDPLLYCIYGGVLCGIGYGLVFSRSGSTGGTDIIAMAIKKKYSNFNIGSLGLILNLIIVSVGSLIFGLPVALYTLISMTMQSILINKVTKGLGSKQMLLIITDKEDEVVEYIISNLNRGVTSLLAEGEFTHCKRKMLYCIVTTRQMILLKTKILEIDPKAFINIVEVSEVKGRGFQALI
ncbi:YitT family protein [Clostridium massiliamazoniense]|uniref:YitT family protein n=1 Tax=Clostridium massiliamazoniense TaxID=1347366 RepID=UPI0006D7C23A|nr:YitT family protein [Clostridium massiliamazoniense]